MRERLTLDEVYYWTFKQLADEHRKICTEECNISLMFLGIAWEKLTGKKLTTDQWKVFM